MYSMSQLNNILLQIVQQLLGSSVSPTSPCNQALPPSPLPPPPAIKPKVADVQQRLASQHALPLVSYLIACRFGVRVSQREIPRLAHILEGFSVEEVAGMRKRTACAAQHLHWSTNLGGIMGETGGSACRRCA